MTFHDLLDLFLPVSRFILDNLWMLIVPITLFWVLHQRAAVKRIIYPATAFLWSIYAGYEAGMQYKVFCTGECNIRIDLMVIYPVLFIAAFAAFEFLMYDTIKRHVDLAKQKNSTNNLSSD